jgi:hypothetical protein
VPGIGIVTFYATGTGFTLLQSVLWNDFSVNFPIVGTIQFGLKALFHAAKQALKGYCVPSAQFLI